MIVGTGHCCSELALQALFDVVIRYDMVNGNAHGPGSGITSREKNFEFLMCHSLGFGQVTG
jgi:hypothetical protein